MRLVLAKVKVEVERRLKVGAGGKLTRLLKRWLMFAWVILMSLAMKKA